MSKPLFRIDVTAEQAELLHELLSRSMAPVQKAQALGGLWVQVKKAAKHYGVEPKPAPIVPPSPPDDES